MPEPSTPTPLDELSDPFLAEHGVRLLMKRDDLIHPTIPGNKWRKLKYNLAAAKEMKEQTLLTFGGAYSNHIYAAASSGRIFGFRTIGIIRGEEHLPLNDVLQHAVDCGMELSYLDRATYRRKYDADVITSLQERFGVFYLLPEGGSNCYAVRGVAELIDEITEDFDYVFCPVGTGGTLAGIITGLRGRAQAMGVSSLKGATFLTDEVRTLLEECGTPDPGNWSVLLDYHFGGFAKRTATLDDFIAQFVEKNQIELDFVYTGKMMYGIYDLVGSGFFPEGSTVVAVHTGGVDTSRPI